MSRINLIWFDDLMKIVDFKLMQILTSPCLWYYPTLHYTTYTTREYISNQIGTFVYLWVDGSYQIVNDATNWRPTKFHVLTDVLMVQLFDWTYLYQQDYILRSTRSLRCAAPRTPVNWTGVLSFLSSFWRLRLFQLFNLNFFRNFCAVYPLSRYNLLTTI